MFIVIALRGMKAFSLNFLVVVVVEERGESVDGHFPQILNFSLRMISALWSWVGKLVFCAVFIYLCVCLFTACLYVCFLITLRELFVGSCINYVVLACYLWLNLFSFGFDVGCDEKLVFFFNFLLLLIIAIYTNVKYSFYG